MSNTRHMGTALTERAHTKDNPAPEAGMSRDTINIGLNIFRAGIRRYTEEEQELLEWLWGYTFDVLGNSKSELARKVGYEFPFIYDVFTGRYDGELDQFCSAIRDLKLKAAAAMPLVRTIVVDRMLQVLDTARDDSALCVIRGSTGRGKTYTAKYWVRNNNHGRSRYIRVPSACTRRQIVTLLCASCGIGVNGHKTPELEQRLFKAFSPRNVLVIDEAGHLIPKASSNGTSAIELLRDLHDICGCGVVLIFTDVYYKEMIGGRSADYFEQFKGRIALELPLPERILRGEVRDVVTYFCPEPTQKLIEFAYKSACEQDGKLRTLFRDLQRAKEWADKNGKPLTLSDLRLAIDWRKSGGIWPEE